MGFLTVLKEILEIVLQFIFSFFRLKNIREKSSKDSIGVDDWRKEDFEFKDLKGKTKIF